MQSSSTRVLVGQMAAMGVGCKNQSKRGSR